MEKIKVMKNNLITTKDLCVKLNVTRQSIYLWRKEGMPVVIASKKTIRYNWGDVKAWLDKNR